MRTRIQPTPLLAVTALLGLSAGLLGTVFLPSAAAAPAPAGGLTPEQADILSHMSIEFLSDGAGGVVKTIRISGVNVQIVNGTGATGGAPDGAGNLIVGYNDLGIFAPAPRTGSHNVVVGDVQSYTSFAGIVAGQANTIDAPYASVLGGALNVAGGQHSTVVGGALNATEALGNGSVITGSLNNVTDTTLQLLP